MLNLFYFIIQIIGLLIAFSLSTCVFLMAVLSNERARPTNPVEIEKAEQFFAIARLDTASQWKWAQLHPSEPTLVVGVSGKLREFIRRFNISKDKEIVKLNKFQQPQFGLFSTMRTNYNADISHAVLKFKNGSSIIFAQLFQLRKNVLFCYGMPTGRTHPSNSNACPPCLCSSVFSRHSLLTLENDDFFHISSLFTLGNILTQYSRFIPCQPVKDDLKQISKPDDIFLIGDALDLKSEPVRAIRQLFEKLDMPLVLDSGTLLGWYRNCSVIDGDIDFDLSVPSSHVNEKFYRDIVHVT